MADVWDPSVPALADDLLAQYLAFVGVERPAAPSLDALATLTTAHLHAIPFENLSSMAGEPVSVEPEALVAKLLSGRRGGYCFEQNLLFAQVLVALGFDVELLPGRFVLGATEPRPRTHLALRIRLGGDVILSDVGYGRTALRGPLRLVAGIEQDQGPDRFRIVDVDGELQLELHGSTGWEPQYKLDPRAAYVIDCEMANHWVATHPKSTMKQLLIVLRPTATGKRSIAGSRLVIAEAGREVDRQITLDELETVLAKEFGLQLPGPLPYLER